MKLRTDYLGTYLSSEQIRQGLTAAAETLALAQAGQECYRGSLGWLNVDDWASPEQVEQMCSLADQIRRDAQVLVLIGVGGSNNAARAGIQALAPDSRVEIVYAGTSTSPYTINRTLERCQDKSVYTICIAKNFETLEPGIAFRQMRCYLRSRYGDAYAKRIVTIGTSGSLLEKLSREEGYCFIPFATDIGGRFTAISSVGLLPMAIAGIDIRQVVQGARDQQVILRSAAPTENPALQYAVIRNLLYQKGYRVELLASFQPQLRFFYKWWVQLFAESEGKAHSGLYPSAAEYSEDLHSVGQYVQDGSPIMFETFLNVEQTENCPLDSDQLADAFAYLDGKDFLEINQAAIQATQEAHSVCLPCLTLLVDKLDAYHFGQLFYFFEFSCYLSARLLGVNPFDQPGVEAYKTLMFQKLGKNDRRN